MKIEHIALYVNDLEAAKDFFVRYNSVRYHNNFQTGEAESFSVLRH